MLALYVLTTPRPSRRNGNPEPRACANAVLKTGAPERNIQQAGKHDSSSKELLIPVATSMTGRRVTAAAGITGDNEKARVSSPYPAPSNSATPSSTAFPSADPRSHLRSSRRATVTVSVGRSLPQLRQLLCRPGRRRFSGLGYTQVQWVGGVKFGDGQLPEVFVQVSRTQTALLT